MKKMKKVYKIKSIIAAILIFISFMMMMFTQVDTRITSTMLNVGMVILAAIFIRKMRSKGQVEKDERTKKIGAWALSYSWLAIIFMISILFWIHEFNWAVLTVKQTLGILLFTAVITMLLFQAYFKHRGDVN